MKFFCTFFIITLILSSHIRADIGDDLKMKAGDAQGNDIKALKAELLISRSDEKALLQLQKLLARYKGSALEPSLHFRLAELYIRRAKTATFFEINRDQSSVVQFTPKEVKNTSSRKWITKAVETYDFIERRFTHFRDMDLVLFNSSFSRQQIGQEQEALRGYRKLIRDYSESPLVPDSHLALGEHYFNKKQFQTAFNEFEKIRKYPEARVYPYGLYKSAWSLYNMQKIDQGLKVLEEVLAYSRRPKEEGENRLDLSRESLDDMVVFFEDSRQASDAVSYFKTQAGDSLVVEIIQKLGRLYQRHSRYKQMEVVFDEIIDRYPKSPLRPEFHKDLIEMYEVTKRRDQTLKHILVWSDLCFEEYSTKQCFKDFIAATKNTVSRWYREHQKRPSDHRRQLLLKGFAALLKTETPYEGRDKVHMNYAELLFQNKNYRFASTHYSKASEKTQDLQIRHDGAYSAIVSLEKAVNDKWNDADENEFIRLTQVYIRLNPQGKYVTDLKFKQAFICYEKGRYDLAAPVLKELATHYSQSERGEKAADLYLDILNIKKDFIKLRDESLRFLGFFKTNEKMKSKLFKVHQESSFAVLQDFEKNKKWFEATQGYRKFAKDFAGSILSDKALYNAIRCAHLDNNYVSAVDASEEYLRLYPQSDKKVEIAQSLVGLYETQAQLGKAAMMYGKLSDWVSDKKAGYLLASADYYALNSEWLKAHGLYKLISQRNGSAEGRIALERLAAYYEREQRWTQASIILESIVVSNIQPQASLAGLKLAEKSFEAHEDDGAFKLAKRVVAMKSDKNVSSWALAQARFIQGQILEKEFDVVGVKAKPERLKYVLQVKTEKLDQAQRAYQEAIRFGDRYTVVEVLFRLGQIYGKYAKALNSIEVPQDATEEDKKKFRQEIENMVLPIEEKGAETLQLALKQAKEIKMRNGTIARIQIELNKLSKRAVSQKLIVDLETPETLLPVVN